MSKNNNFRFVDDIDFRIVTIEREGLIDAAPIDGIENPTIGFYSSTGDEYVEFKDTWYRDSVLEDFKSYQQHLKGANHE